VDASDRNFESVGCGFDPRRGHLIFNTGFSSRNTHIKKGLHFRSPFLITATVLQPESSVSCLEIQQILRVSEKMPNHFFGIVDMRTNKGHSTQ
jgi:hypothetical protein